MRLKIIFPILFIAALALPEQLFAAKFQPAGSTQRSLNWAGYVTDQGKFNAVSGSWTIPKISGSKIFKTDATWVGIGGVNSTDLIQAGTQQVTGVPGRVGYLAWYELLPDFSQPVALAVRAGDSITVQIVHGSGRSWRINIKNNSTGQAVLKNVSYASTFSSAEWIEEMPSNSNDQLIPLDNFRSVQFSSGYAFQGSKRLSIAAAHSRPVSLYSPGGKLLAEPSVLGHNGAAFAVKRIRG